MTRFKRANFVEFLELNGFTFKNGYYRYQTCKKSLTISIVLHKRYTTCAIKRLYNSKQFSITYHKGSRDSIRNLLVSLDLVDDYSQIPY